MWLAQEKDRRPCPSSPGCSLTHREKPVLVSLGCRPPARGASGDLRLVLDSALGLPGACCSPHRAAAAGGDAWSEMGILQR